MPKFLSIIDMSNLEIVNLKIHNSPSAPYNANTGKGSLWMDTASNRLNWSDGINWRAIFPFDTLANGNTAVLRDGAGGFSAGTITATLFDGTATQANKLTNGRAIGITGKATAAGVSFDGTAAINLSVTALSVVPGEITLANNQIIVGNGSGVGAAVAKSTLLLSELGAPTSSVAFGGQRITGLANPTDDQDAATKLYVDQTAQGLDPKGSCRVATTADLGGTYNGINKTMTGPAAPLIIDGVTLAVGERVLVKNETTGGGASENGIYTVTNAGTYSVAWVLTRAVDFNTSAKATPGSFTFIEEGTTNKDTGWVMTADAPVALDTTLLTWTQFSGAGSYTAGRGIVQNGSVFNFAQNTDYTTNSIPYATGATTIGFTAAGTAHQILRVPAGGGAPAFGAIDVSATAAIVGTLAAANGGTGQSSYTIGDILYASAANALSRLADVAVGNVLISGGVGVAPSWNKVGLTTHVTGILPLANGGTGLSSWTTNGVFYGGASAMGQTAAPSSGQLLVGNASGVPTFVGMSGDATLAAAGAITIAANAVTYAKFQQITGLSVFGNSGSAAANGGAITGTAYQVLRVNDAGNALAFGAINIANGNAVTGVLQGSNGGTGTAYVQFTTGGTTLRTYTLPNFNCALPTAFSGTFTGNNTGNVFDAIHNRGTKLVVISLTDANDNVVYVDTTIIDVNTVRFTFAVAPASGAVYRWTIIASY
jgi:hypothetical protein